MYTKLKYLGNLCILALFIKTKLTRIIFVIYASNYPRKTLQFLIKLIIFQRVCIKLNI